MAKLRDDVDSDFVIVIDTREQEPYRFAGENVIFNKLESGDYSVKGFEDKIAIERKSHGDFLHSITHRRTQFMNEMARMKPYKVKVIVIETDYFMLEKGAYQYAHVNPEATIGSIVKIVTDFGVSVMTLSNRKSSESFTLKMLKRAFMVMRGIK